MPFAVVAAAGRLSLDSIIISRRVFDGLVGAGGGMVDTLFSSVVWASSAEVIRGRIGFLGFRRDFIGNVAMVLTLYVRKYFYWQTLNENFIFTPLRLASTRSHHPQSDL